MRHAIRLLLASLAVLPLLFAALLLAYAVLPPVSTLMLWRWAAGAPVVRLWTPIERIEPRLVRSVIASEDTGFCSHHGVAWAELKEVIEDAEEDRPRRGASTLTMQVAKNLFLWHGRSYVRKGLEIPLALVIDLFWSKRRILEVYLNIAEWGPGGEFGAEAGARRAFAKGAASLSAREAALLVTMLPNPRRRNAARPTARMHRIAGIVSGRVAATPDIAACVLR